VKCFLVYLACHGPLGNTAEGFGWRNEITSNDQQGHMSVPDSNTDYGVRSAISDCYIHI